MTANKTADPPIYRVQTLDQKQALRMVLIYGADKTAPKTFLNNFSKSEQKQPFFTVFI